MRGPTDLGPVADRAALAVVVLAAGAGRRLAAANGGRPKWLTDVGSRSIADRQMEALDGALGLDDRVLVVGGHRVDDLRRWLADRTAPVPVHLLVNDAYASRNNWFSLLLALRVLHDRAWTGPVVVLNGDLCAPAPWYEPLLGAVRHDPEHAGLLAIDGERPLTDEAMKVSISPGAGGDGPTCLRIGKVDVPGAAGEYVGMAALGRTTWGRLLDVLATFEADPERANAWYEAGFQLLMDDGLLHPWPVPDTGWVEIDDDVDLATAERLFEPT